MGEKGENTHWIWNANPREKEASALEPFLQQFKADLFLCKMLPEREPGCNDILHEKMITKVAAKSWRSPTKHFIFFRFNLILERLVLLQIWELIY